MSVTIHYNGKLDNRARLAELLDAARLYCAEQRWAYRDVQEQIFGTLERVIDSKSEPSEVARDAGSPLPLDEADTPPEPIDEILEGIVVSPHPNSEPLWLTFNRAGELTNYLPLDDLGTYWEVKALFFRTQSAGIGTHAAVCDLLHLLQNEYMPGLNVYDESNYFESGDVLRAEDAMDSVDDALDQLQATLDGMDADDPRAEYVREVMQTMASEQAKKKLPPRKQTSAGGGSKIPHAKPRRQPGHGSSAGKY